MVNDTRIIPPSAMINWGGDFTLSAWFMAVSNSTNERCFFISGAYTVNGFRFCLYYDKLAFLTSENGGDIFGLTNFIPLNNVWSHGVVTFNSSGIDNSGTIKIYGNGKLVGSFAGNLVPGASGLIIGSDQGTLLYAGLDEMAVWGRALNKDEVLQLYRRGANRLNYQVRTCSTFDCSDQESLVGNAMGWRGVDGSSKTFFSELYNTLGSILGTFAKASSPVFNFGEFTTQGFYLSPNRYFQYKLILESDDQNNLCNYGAENLPCSPEIIEMSVKH
jgi:trimeric autotransporter adhesin